MQKTKNVPAIKLLSVKTLGNMLLQLKSRFMRSSIKCLYCFYRCSWVTGDISVLAGTGCTETLLVGDDIS